MSEKSSNYSFSQVPNWIILIACLLSGSMLFLAGVNIGTFVVKNDRVGQVVQYDAPETSESAAIGADKSLSAKNTPLLTKTFGKIEVGAYVDDEAMQDAFIVAPIENGLPVVDIGTYALSFAANFYSMDNLFDVVGDKIYIVNQNRGFIDVYTLKYSEKTADAPAVYQMKYSDYIAGPQYNVGVPYSIICTGNICDIKTAFHQEAGCEMKLDVLTKQYSNLSCGGMGGEITPQPLQ